MKIGIFSDSHDNIPKIEKAIAFFNKNKAGFILHAGDFVAPFSIPKIKKAACGWMGVFGNNDGERAGLSQISGGKIKEGPVRIELDNRKITLVHDLNKIDCRKEEADLIVFGHTHKPEIKEQYGKLFLNPGECGGWLTGKSTVVLADLTHLSARIFKI